MWRESQSICKPLLMYLIYSGGSKQQFSCSLVLELAGFTSEG
jgi:hypothetical protein